LVFGELLDKVNARVEFKQKKITCMGCGAVWVREQKKKRKKQRTKGELSLHLSFSFFFFLHCGLDKTRRTLKEETAKKTQALPAVFSVVILAGIHMDSGISGILCTTLFPVPSAPCNHSFPYFLRCPPNTHSHSQTHNYWFLMQVQGDVVMLL
jgi:hypothetical protein